MYAIFEAFLMLIDFHGYIFRDDFASLYRRVRQYPVARFSHGHRTSEQICRAVDLACIWYPKEVFCLQRSAVTVCLLRRLCTPRYA